jgi:hypothetical protein
LKGKPIFGLANVQEVPIDAARSLRTRASETRSKTYLVYAVQAASLLDYLPGLMENTHALAFFLALDILLGETKFSTIVKVQLHLFFDMSDNGCRLYMKSAACYP